MTVILRPARTTDAGKVGAILTEFVETTPWMPNLHTGAQNISFSGRMIDKGWVTVAENASILAFMTRDGIEVDALYVAASARGQGIGSQLIEAAKAASPELELWTFQANTGAQRFYTRHGFREIKRTEGANNDEKLPDIRYRWERDPS